MSSVPGHDIEDPITILHISGNMKMSEMHYHNAYEIGILMDGDRSYMIEDQLMHFRPRDVRLIKPNVIHCAVGGNYSGTVIEFTESYLEYFFSKKAAESITECFEKKVIRIRESDFECLMSLVERLTADENDFFAFAKIIDILKNNMSRRTYDLKSTSPRVADIVDYITENYQKIDSLNMIADKFYISKEHLCRLFKENNNISIMRYINILKIRSSLEYVAQNSLPIAKIAEKCGFKNLSYFGETFKSIMGMSPSEYRKNSNSENKKTLNNTQRKPPC